jgi:hypothetical protein
MAEPSNASPRGFVSRLKLLSIVDFERMSPAQRQRREGAELAEFEQWREEQRRAAWPAPAKVKP